jgi:hypothetical protein
MEIFVKGFQLTIPVGKEKFYSALEQLVGWQPNRFSWQQGRFRTLIVDVDTNEQTLLTLTTSFTSLIPLVRLHIQLKNNSLNNLYIAEVKARFSYGVFVFAAFFSIFFLAITASHYHILVKLFSYGMICLVCYTAFLGIYRDRENLISDLIKVQSQFTAAE